MNIRPVRERDLGRIQMFGSVTIVFLTLVLIGNFVVVGQYEAHEQKLRQQKERLMQRAVAGVEQEGAQLYRYISYYQQLTEERLRRSVKERVEQASAIALKVSRKYRGPKTRGRIKEVLSQLQWRNGYSYIWIVDRKGKAVLFNSNPLIEGENILDTTDARGKQVVKDAIAVAMQQGEGYVEDIMMRIDGNTSVEQIAFVKYLPRLEWIIGTGETIDDIELATQKELLGRMRSMRPQSGSIGVTDAKHTLLVGTEAPPRPETERALNKSVRYDTRDGEALLFAKKIPKWDWTIFITLPLSGVEAHIAELEAQVDADFKKGLFVLGTLFLGASAFSVVLSYLLAQRMRFSFRRYRRTVLAQRKSMRRLYRDLSREQKRSNEALQAKNRFLANLSHELHTPLTALMGYANLLKEQLPAHYRKSAEIIAEASEQLLVLQDDLIACSDAKTIPVEHNYFDAAKMVVHFYHLFAKESDKRDTRWCLFGADEAIMVISDQAKVYRMLLALLSIVFEQSDHSRLELRLRKKAGKVRISVCDLLHTVSDEKMCTGAFEQAHAQLGAGSLESTWAVVHSFAEILGLRMHQRVHKRLGRCYWFELGCGEAERTVPDTLKRVLDEEEREQMQRVLRLGHLASIKEAAEEIRDPGTREMVLRHLEEGDLKAVERLVTR